MECSVTLESNIEGYVKKCSNIGKYFALWKSSWGYSKMIYCDQCMINIKIRNNNFGLDAFFLSEEESKYEKILLLI